MKREFKVGDKIKFVGAIFGASNRDMGYYHQTAAWEITNIFKHGNPQAAKQWQLEIRCGEITGKICSGQVTHRIKKKEAPKREERWIVVCESFVGPSRERVFNSQGEAACSALTPLHSPRKFVELRPGEVIVSRADIEKAFWKGKNEAMPTVPGLAAIPMDVLDNMCKALGLDPKKGE